MGLGFRVLNPKPTRNLLAWSEWNFGDVPYDAHCWLQSMSPNLFNGTSGTTGPLRPATIGCHLLARARPAGGRVAARDRSCLSVVFLRNARLKDVSSAKQAVSKSCCWRPSRKRARPKHSKIQHAKNMRKSSKHAKTTKLEFLGFRMACAENCSSCEVP